MVSRRNWKALYAVNHRGGGPVRAVVLLLGLVAAAMILVAAVVMLWLSLADLELFAGKSLLGGEWAKPLLAHLQDGLGISALVVLAAVAAVGALAALVALFRSSRQDAGASRRHVLVADDQGFVLVDNRGIEAVACAAALRAPGVVEAEVEVRGQSGLPIRLNAAVGVYPGAQIEEAGRAARQLVRRAVETVVGLEVSDVVVSVHVLDAEDFGRGLL